MRDLGRGKEGGVGGGRGVSPPCLHYFSLCPPHQHVFTGIQTSSKPAINRVFFTYHKRA